MTGARPVSEVKNMKSNAMIYHIMFGVICFAVALGVDYERAGHKQGLAFGELEVSNYVGDYAPRIAGLGRDIALDSGLGDLGLTDVVQLRGALFGGGSGDNLPDLGGDALIAPVPLNSGRLLSAD